MAVVWHPVLPDTKQPQPSLSSPLPSTPRPNVNGADEEGGRRFALGLYHLALDVTKLTIEKDEEEEEDPAGEPRRGSKDKESRDKESRGVVKGTSHTNGNPHESTHDRTSPSSARSSLTALHSGNKSMLVRSGSHDRSSAGRVGCLMFTLSPRVHTFPSPFSLAPSH